VERAPVAIVYDYEASWLTRIQPQGQDFCYHELVFRWYEAVRKLGLDVDFVAPGAPLSGYALVLVPSLPVVSEAAARALEMATGIIVLGPRTGSKTRNVSIPANLAPGPLADLTGVRVVQVASLRPDLAHAVEGAVSGEAIRWREYVEATGETLAHFTGGDPALVAKGSCLYLACWPDQMLLGNVMRLACERACGNDHREAEPLEHDRDHAARAVRTRWGCSLDRDFDFCFGNRHSRAPHTCSAGKHEQTTCQPGQQVE
jgi:beta-galactosidase